MQAYHLLLLLGVGLEGLSAGLQLRLLLLLLPCVGAAERVLLLPLHASHLQLPSGGSAAADMQQHSYIKGEAGKHTGGAPFLLTFRWLLTSACCRSAASSSSSSQQMLLANC
jgi:hypothetical protein